MRPNCVHIHTAIALKMHSFQRIHWYTPSSLSCIVNVVTIYSCKCKSKQSKSFFLYQNNNLAYKLVQFPFTLHFIWSKVPLIFFFTTFYLNILPLLGVSFCKPKFIFLDIFHKNLCNRYLLWSALIKFQTFRSYVSSLSLSPFLCFYLSIYLSIYLSDGRYIIFT